MNRKYAWLILVLIFCLIFVLNLNAARNMARIYLPQDIKNLIKETILGKEKIQKLNSLQSLEVKNHFKMHYNEKLLPETHFLNISYKEVILNSFLKERISKNYGLTSHSKSNFFIEQYKENFVIVTDAAEIFFINKSFIKDSNNFNYARINSNLESSKVDVLDVLILEKEIYISYSEIISEKCSTLNISKAKISKQKLIFEIFFKSEDCQTKFFAGKMALYKHDDKMGLLLTADIWGVALVEERPRKEATILAQNDESTFGKILFIDFESKKFKIFSKGHRTPQGLFVVNNNFILSTEHGPRGGDEINLIKFGKNYGWPISSYGETYHNQKQSTKKYQYLKNHENNGYVEPIYSFVPSIGISQIIKVPDDFSEYWKNNFLVTSLNGGSIYRILFDKNFTKVIFREKIFIGKRIRDIIYLKELNTFLLSLDDGDGVLGILSTNSD